MKSKQVIVALLSLLSPLAKGEYITNESDDVGGAPHRVNIPPFTLTIFPTSGFSRDQEDLVVDMADEVLHDLFPTKVAVGVQVDYVSLRSVVRDNTLDRRRLQEDETTVLQISGGIASFRGGQPRVDEVNAWVSEALEGPLLEILQEETELNEIQSIVFTSLTPAPTPSPSSQSNSVGIASESNVQADDNDTIKIAGGVVGVMAVASIALLALLTMSRQKRATALEPVARGSVKKVLPTVDGDGADDSDDEESLETNQNRAFADDDSVSVSEWTMSTNVTDAYTVKSGKVFPGISHSLMQTESFERDRQVSLKKDMLQTPWSTAIPRDTVYQGKSTVLVPSHFRVQKSPSRDSFDEDSEWNPDDNDATSSVDQDSPFLFEALGDEVVLMPPSQTRSCRRDTF
jgi:hypothetical protein